MKRKSIILHRQSNCIDCRKYDEQYVKYFYTPKEPTTIRDDKIFIDSTIQKDILEDELVKSEAILSNVLNLGKSIYDSYLHKDIYKSYYLYDRYVFEIIKANSFDEFIKFEIWKHPEIESIITEWFNSNPFYGDIIEDEDGLYAVPIDLNSFATLAISSYMIYRLHKLSYKKIVFDETTKELSLLAVFSDIIKKPNQRKDSYILALKNLKAEEIQSNCIKILKYLISNYNPIRYHVKIFEDNSIVKIHESLLSISFETLMSIICYHSRTIATCSNCGSFYLGHGNSTLCIPCRKYKDNHKHIKNR